MSSGLATEFRGARKGGSCHWCWCWCRRWRSGQRRGWRNSQSRVVGERGSGTVWAVCLLFLVSAAAGWALLWVTVESTRHSAERAADTAALAAASAAVHRLAAQSGPDPCASAALAAQQAGGTLTACTCTVLDCKVSVQRAMPFLGSLAVRLPALRGIGPVRAVSRAGPVGETGSGDIDGRGD